MALKHKFSEVVTVSSTAIGITATELVDSNGLTQDIIMARFQLLSGGKIHENAVNTPVAAAGDDWGRIKGTEWEVWGGSDLTNYLMVKQTGEADAKVVIHGYGN
jgi:hypothetical protein